MVGTAFHLVSILRYSLSPDPFFAFLFSFLFVRDTNLAHLIKKLFTSLPFFVQPQTQTWIKAADEKNAKMQDICNKETKTTAASLPQIFRHCMQENNEKQRY